MIDEDAIRRRFEALRDQLDERGQRLFAAAEARAAGYGGLAAVALRALGRTLSASSVRALLAQLGYRRQANRKTNDGAHHADRDAQFAHINTRVLAAQAAEQPVISVDAEKKELIGNFRNGGSDYRPVGRPRRVNVHDFADKDLGKVVPYDVYDLTANAGWVSVGIDHDTAAFAANAA